MPTTYLRPTAVGYSDGLTLVAGANKVVAVDANDPLSHDDVTTYIRHTNTGQTQAFTLTNLPPAYGIVTAVRGGSRSVTLSGNVGGNFFLRLGGSNAAAWGSHGNEFSWTSRTGVSDRPGGGQWTMADIQSAGLEMGFTSGGSATDYCGITSMWIEVDWEYPPGGFAFLL